MHDKMPINGSTIQNQKEIYNELTALKLQITELRGEIKTMRALGIAFVIIIEISMPIMWALVNSGGV